MTVHKIDKKIVGYEVVNAENTAEREAEALAAAPKLQEIHEALDRPEVLLGSTYKIKTPMSEHALYVTINDIVLNEGTEHEQRWPFEVFINSKNMDHFQWVVALTRLMSAVFRKGGDVTFLVEELKAVFDPQGGYFKPGGKFMPSLVAEIGDAIERHMKMIGLIQEEGLSPHQLALINEKRAEYDKMNGKKQAPVDDNGSFPPDATLCNKCNTKAVVMMDGCHTCLNCGDSKCS
ncbi:MAG: NrdJb [Natronospirillum sp.]|uniref:TSCPD domain-containing protein n=1 Tax=Natronospirillum sp. TaxID=2812955 RepID=UPI0025DEA473|nr:NrdJb [Natronospirillum sp.]MCH8552818.1 NrdJb [Natronospirillum sp.]